MGKKKSRGRTVSSPVAAPQTAAPTTADDPDEVYDPKLKIGDQVVLQNLKSQQFNGKVGTVQSVPNSKAMPIKRSSRYGILIEDGSSEAIAIQAKNIQQVFKIDDQVAIRGLENKKMYNGLCGTVVQVPQSVSDNEARYGVRLDGLTEIPVLAIRAENLYLASRMSTQAQREFKKQWINSLGKEKEDGMYVDRLAMARTMMSMFASEEKQIQVFGRKITPLPDYWAELQEHRAGLPKGVDRSWANHYLRCAFEHDSALPHNFEFLFKQEDYQPNSQYILKRLGSNDRKKMEWYFTSNRLGDINPHRCVGSYNPFHRHSFSNQTYRSETLQRGTTHVAVGFVDLGILLTMNLEDPPTLPSSSSWAKQNLDSNAPLHFVGVEMSAYSVAKAHVLWEMLACTPESSSLQKERQAHLCKILQVWFSASWGQGTYDLVKYCLARLCQSKNSYHGDVREILEHWAAATRAFPLKSAREQFMKATTSNKATVGHFLRKKDRIAVARYELSGDFALNGEDPVSGNTIMFDCPDGTPPLENDETIFSVFSTFDLMNNVKANTDMSFIAAAETFALSKISELAHLVEQKLVSIEFICAKVETVLDEIAAMKPWTMSWSNLPDYFDYKEFHRMARRCSIHGDTIHLGYSMNWSIEVMGTNILDFARDKSQTEARRQILDKTNEVVELVYKDFGWETYFRLPPPTNPINTTSNFMLEPAQYRLWAKYFFDLARRDGGTCQVAHVQHALGCSVFAPTGSSTVYMTWTYDPEMTFKKSGPSLSDLTEEPV
ncbi:hypothetical protein ACA910_011561 [Epithemia clementina (nom. ined.)]